MYLFAYQSSETIDSYTPLLFLGDFISNSIFPIAKGKDRIGPLVPLSVFFLFCLARVIERYIAVRSTHIYTHLSVTNADSDGDDDDYMIEDQIATSDLAFLDTCYRPPQSGVYLFRICTIGDAQLFFDYGLLIDISVERDDIIVRNPCSFKPLYVCTHTHTHIYIGTELHNTAEDAFDLNLGRVYNLVS